MCRFVIKQCFLQIITKRLLGFAGRFESPFPFWIWIAKKIKYWSVIQNFQNWNSIVLPHCLISSQPTLLTMPQKVSESQTILLQRLWVDSLCSHAPRGHLMSALLAACSKPSAKPSHNCVEFGEKSLAHLRGAKWPKAPSFGPEHQTRPWLACLISIPLLAFPI